MGMVLIPKKTRKQILEHLFKEGVMCVKHDARAHRHNELEDVPNLHVMMVLRSLASRSYLDEKYNWGWHYYFLTNEGIDYLRDVLHLPAHFVPQRLQSSGPLGRHCQKVKPMKARAKVKEKVAGER